MSRRSFSKSLDISIFAAVAVILFALLALLSSNLMFQYSNYRDGISLALKDPQYIDHASILTYSRAWDFAVAKTSALFLSFLLIFTGAMYVLRTAESRFKASVEKDNFKGTISLNSPGLIMVTLGVFLVAFVLSNKTFINYSRQGLTQHPQLETKDFGNAEIAPITPIETTKETVKDE